MIDILSKSIEEMPGLSYDCDCGRNHSVDIKKIVIRSNILPVLAGELESYRKGKLLVVADENTHKVLGKAVVEQLEQDGFNLKEFVFEGSHTLVPDERSIGRLLMELEEDTTFVLAVGSGTLNDLARIVSSKVKLPFAIIGTAPSMDGFASASSSLIINGIKQTCQGVYPTFIFADTSIMKDAPMDMIRAGYGDIIGKLAAKADWDLATVFDDEYYCDATSRLVQNGVAKCIESAEGLEKRDEAAIKMLVEALILTGVSMGLVKFSRPASGAEHLMSHHWEMDAVAAGREHQLHGNAVGTGTVISAMLYEMTAEQLPGVLPEGLKYPSSVYIISLLNKVGGCTNPKDLGIDRELFRNSVLRAKRLRSKYTILNLLDDKGRLQEFADILTRRFYD